MAVEEWHVCVVYEDSKSIYVTTVHSRSVRDGRRGAWVGRARLVTPALDGHVPPLATLKRILAALSRSGADG